MNVNEPSNPIPANVDQIIDGLVQPPGMIYMIVNRDTGKFSPGGQRCMHGRWGKTPKVWRSLVELKAHLVRLADWGFRVPDSWTVIESGPAGTKQVQANTLPLPKR